LTIIGGFVDRTPQASTGPPTRNDIIDVLTGDIPLKGSIQLSITEWILLGLATTATFWPFIAWLFVSYSTLSQKLVILHSIALALLVTLSLFLVISRRCRQGGSSTSLSGGTGDRPVKQAGGMHHTMIGDDQRYRLTMAIRMRKTSPARIRRSGTEAPAPGQNYPPRQWTARKKDSARLAWPGHLVI
jgi:hypothetical protein